VPDQLGKYQDKALVIYFYEDSDDFILKYSICGYN